MALLVSAAIYFVHGLSIGKRRYFVLSTVILNLGFCVVWFSHGFTDLQFHRVPIGLSILWIVELLKTELPSQTQEPLRYIGALVILVSPVFGVLGTDGSTSSRLWSYVSWLSYLRSAYGFER